METHVVLEADWFTIKGQTYLKQIAFCASGNGKHGTHSFTLPAWVGAHRHALDLQARFSHGLCWNSAGTHRYNQIHQVFDELLLELSAPLSQLKFFSKGAEKCRLLEPYVGPVTNLEDLECPRYDQLTNLPNTTLSKAVVFSLWLDTDF
jgi:hypothetical protein